MKKLNQMCIGMTKDLEHGFPRFVAIPREDRGLVFYSAIPGGLRLTIFSGDGLDSYHFDLDVRSLKDMHDISAFYPADYKAGAGHSAS